MNIQPIILWLSKLHTCQHLKVRKQNTRYCEGAKRPSPREGSSWGGEGVPPSHGRELLHFWTSNCAIWYSGAYLERKFRLKIYCIAWKATNLKIPKTERSVFLGFKNFKNRTVLLKTERLASLKLGGKYVNLNLIKDTTDTDSKWAPRDRVCMCTLTLVTVTSLVCPRRWHRSKHCSSHAGFQAWYKHMRESKQGQFQHTVKVEIFARLIFRAQPRKMNFACFEFRGQQACTRKHAFWHNIRAVLFSRLTILPRNAWKFPLLQYVINITWLFWSTQSVTYAGLSQGRGFTIVPTRYNQFDWFHR